MSNYVYDKLGRLTAETITDAVNGNYSAAYTHDKVGNYLTQMPKTTPVDIFSRFRTVLAAAY